MYVGERLKELRKEHNYTLENVEGLTGIRKATLSKYENSHNSPNEININKLADFYDVTTDYIYGRDIAVVAEKDEDYKIKVPKIDVKILKILHREENKYILNYLRGDPERRIKGLNENYKFDD